MPGRGSNDSEKKHVAVAYGLASDYSVRALRVGQYVDQSSSRGLEKFGVDILTSPEVTRAQTLHFKPNFKFSRLKILGGPLSQLWCALARLGQSVTHIKI